jgi:hypothetical protein
MILAVSLHDATIQYGTVVDPYEYYILIQIDNFLNYSYYLPQAITKVV